VENRNPFDAFTHSYRATGVFVRAALRHTVLIRLVTFNAVAQSMNAVDWQLSDLELNPSQKGP